MSLPETTIREKTLRGVLVFVREAVAIEGVRRIGLLGSIITGKSNPKDVDLLVTVTDEADLAPLAKCTRQLQGRVQGLNRGTDVFLADESGRYLGRICKWRRCGPGIRASCYALHCGRRHYLHDDLGTVKLDSALVAEPPVQLWPTVIRRCPLPDDVELLLAELEHFA